MTLHKIPCSPSREAGGEGEGGGRSDAKGERGETEQPVARGEAQRIIAMGERGGLSGVVPGWGVE